MKEYNRGVQFTILVCFLQQTRYLSSKIHIDWEIINPKERNKFSKDKNLKDKHVEI